MAIPTPTMQELQQLALEFGFELDPNQVRATQKDMTSILNRVYAPLDAMVDPAPDVRYPRSPGYQPDAAEDPLHLWYRKTDIRGAAGGPLADRSVAVKDNICVAGVPMMNGASTLQGFVPDIDATVVQRVLEAGAVLAGKTHCEYLCASAGSHTNATGVTRNPFRHDCTSGGSSSGSAVAVATGQADFALGGDQGGSIRIPASFCGVVGLKPTYGLVPYTGIMPVEMTLDHVGPMSLSVRDNAALLEVIAGRDGLDPRQVDSGSGNYSAALEQGAKGLRIGVVKEAFDWPMSQRDVDETVQAAARRFESLGAEVQVISIPEHLTAVQIWMPILIEGFNSLMLRGNALGNNWKGYYPTSLLRAQAGWRLSSNQFPSELKTLVMLGEHVRQSGQGMHYARAQNLSRSLRGAYDRALESCDVLLLPTVPIVAPKLPEDNPDGTPGAGPGMTAIVNTAPFNCSGHPVISIPCGVSDELPVGMSLVGGHFDEATVYRAAHAYERNFDWKADPE